ncbi:MAG: thioredoxin [Clostridia bacterium]
MSVIKLSVENFDKEIAGSDVPVLVDFWAPWCGPCKMLGPIIEDVASEVGEDAKICKVNIDDNPELAAKFGVMSIPTMIVFKNGEESEKVVGLRQKKDIISMLK